MSKRTNIVLDERLVEEARRCAGDEAGSVRELVDLALREFVENHRRKDLRELRGSAEIAAGYDHKKLRTGERQGDCHSGERQGDCHSGEQ